MEAVLDAARAAAPRRAAPRTRTREESSSDTSQRRVSSRMVSIVAFTLGVAWMFCLPVVSVVTGELKVRGTYFDETTLSPMAARATLHTSEGFRDYLRKRHGSFCDELLALDIACQERYNASWGVVRPASGWAAVEAIAVVAANKRAIPIVLALARFLRDAPWLGKNIVVVASDDPQRWVGAYHNGDDEDCP